MRLKFTNLWMAGSVICMVLLVNLLSRTNSDSVAEIQNQEVIMSTIAGVPIGSIFQDREPNLKALEDLRALPSKPVRGCGQTGYFERVARSLGLTSSVYALNDCSCGGWGCPCMGCGYIPMLYQCHFFDCDSGSFHSPLKDWDIAQTIGTRDTVGTVCASGWNCGCPLETCDNTANCGGTI